MSRSPDRSLPRHARLAAAAGVAALLALPGLAGAAEKASATFVDPDGQGATYTLRAFGYSFEEIRFRPAPGGGSTAEVLLAPGLSARWRADFARDRLAPLQTCAG